MPARLPTAFFYGTGNVGLGLALALQARGWPVLGAWNRGADRADRASRALGVPVARGKFVPAPPAEARLLWIGVTDDAVASVGQALGAYTLPSDCVVAHLSGCLPARALGPLAATCGSMHPLLACPTPELARDALPGAFFALEGEDEALQVLKRVVHTLGGSHTILAASAKPRYHAAAVMASNLMVALLDMAVQESQAAGVAQAASALAHFAIGALQHAERLGTVGGLTGPVRRGDLHTLRAHINSLGPAALRVYRRLSLHALRMSEQHGLTRQQLGAARQILADDNDD